MAAADQHVPENDDALNRSPADRAQSPAGKVMKAALDAHVANINANTRPAAFVENPKPLFSDSAGMPTLVELLEARKQGGDPN